MVVRLSCILMHTGVSSYWVVWQVFFERYTRVLLEASLEFPIHFLKIYSTRLRPAVSHGWLSRVHDGLADPLWVLGAAATPPGHRPRTEAALDTAATVALRAGGQDRAPAAPGAGAAPCGVRLPGDRQCRVGSPRLPDQHRVH